MLKRILLGFGLAVLVAVVILVVVIQMQPDTFAVERSVVVEAPADEIFPHINDFKAWDAWSPWAQLDPNATMTFSDPASGKGATMSWAGNDQVGEGKMTILESRPGEFVEFEQEFFKPMAGKAGLKVSLTPGSGGTKVHWRMEGENDFLGKAMCLLMDMDAMIGMDFEKALAKIKEVAEKKKS